MADSKEKLKSFLMKVKEGGEKADLKYNIRKTKIMASGPIPSWKKKKKRWVKSKNSNRLFGLKITADCSCEFMMLAP